MPIHLKTLVLATVLISLVSLPGLSQAVTNVEEAISREMQSWQTVKVRKKEGLALRTAFSCSFFTATPRTSYPDGTTMSGGSVLFYENGRTVKSLFRPSVFASSNDESMPELMACIHEDFRITNLEEAGILAEALEKLFEQSSSFPEEAEIKRFQNGWVIINDEFFGKRQGYIITTNSEGAVLRVGYSVSIDQH